MIAIVAYRPSWTVEFQEIATVLRANLGEVALRIDHVGSTSVPNLCAKDVIDIQVTVESFDEGLAERLRNLNLVQRPDIQGDHVPPGCAGPDEDWKKLFFVQANGQRRLNIHIRQAGRPNQRYALLFRDYLVRHPQAAAAYGELKRRLAASFVSEEAYADVKDPAVDLIYFAAEQWASHIQWQTEPRNTHI
jgi:GrpB-like predicted nucleotidyltransferase (UPF0157 family)